MVKTSTVSITKQVLNENTGEFETERYTKDISYKKSFRRGWYMQYKDYDNMLGVVVKSNRDIMLITHLKLMINRDFEIHINITKEATKIGVGRDKLSKLISSLIDANFLYRDEVCFKSNPFMYIPYMARDVAIKQSEWEELMRLKNGNNNK